MVIMQDALPGLKRFLKPVGLNERMLALVIRCVAAFVMHFGRMAAARAATAIRSEPRHRAQMCRFLGRKLLRRLSPAATLRSQLLMMESRLSGTFFFLIDQTLVSQQGGKTENTFSTGNRKRRRFLKNIDVSPEDFDLGRDRTDVMNERPRERPRRWERSENEIDI